MNGKIVKQISNDYTVKIDNEFIISIIGKVQLHYEHKIENVENVVKKISIEHFKEKSIST